METTHRPGADAAIEEIDILMTAEEAYVAFERAVFGAKRSVLACFRVFDLTTRLRDESARTFGETWFDLVLAKLNDGVRFDITITDFDPLLATDDHRRSWASARQLAALAELSSGAKLHFDIAMHPARVGAVPRRLLKSKLTSELESRQSDPLTPGLEAMDTSATPPLVPATHHQKLAVIDGRQLYIGGLDLNERRYDTHAHDRPADQTWHDIHALVRGPVVDAAISHLQSFKAVAEGDGDPPPAAPGFLRTISARRRPGLFRMSPRTVLAELEQAHLDAIARTEGPIYLETQFFRHLPLADALARAAGETPDLTCLLILPAAPEDVAFEGNDREDAQLGAKLQVDCIDRISGAFGDRLAVAAPARPVRARADARDAATLHGAEIIYVHSKLSLFGSAEAILSSANLNGRSMKWDTEAGIHVTRPDQVAALWQRALAHWFGDLDHPDPLTDQRAFIDWCRNATRQNAAREPEDRPHLLLPFPQDRHRDLAAPVPGVPDETV